MALATETVLIRVGKLAGSSASPTAILVLTFYVFVVVFKVLFFRLCMPVCAINTFPTRGPIWALFRKLLAPFSLLPCLDNFKLIFANTIVVFLSFAWAA